MVDVAERTRAVRGRWRMGPGLALSARTLCILTNVNEGDRRHVRERVERATIGFRA